MSIHPSAVVDPGARLGREVGIGPFCVIEADVEIGDGTVIGPSVHIARHTTLGPRCRVHAHAVLGDLPQDLAFRPEDVSSVRIGAGCVIREGVTVHRGTQPGTATEIGDGCFLMAYAHCAHNVRLAPGVVMASGALLAGYVEVGERAFISGNVVVHQFVRVGRLAMLGGMSAIGKDVPPFAMTLPAARNRIVGCNIVGMRRAGMDAAARLDVLRAYRLLYRSGLNVRQAVEELKKAFSGGPAAEIAPFVEASRRGICAFGGGDDGDPD